MPDWLKLTQERYKKAKEFYRPFHQTVGMDYDFYRGFYRGDWAQQWRNQISLPWFLTLIQADVSRKAQIAFGTSPAVEFYGPDGKLARKTTALVSEQLTEDRSFEKAVDFFLGANMYGTGFARPTWLSVVRKGKRRRAAPIPGIIGGAGQELLENEDHVIFDGPHWEPLDILDVMPQPGVPDIQKVRYVFFDYVLDIQDVEMWTAAGTFDTAGLAKLKASSGPSKEAQSAHSWRSNVFRSQYDMEARMTEPHSTVVHLTDMVGYVPNEFAEGGSIFKIVTMANENVILRARDYEFGEVLPLLRYAPMRDPHQLYGVGKIAVCRKVMALANRTASQKADSLDFNLDPPIFANRLLGLDDENLYMRAGRVTNVDGSVDESQLRQFMPDMRGFSAAEAQIETYWRVAQQAFGMIEDVGGIGPGGGSSDRQTKAEFVGRQEGMLTRQLLEARLAEKGLVEPLADSFAYMNYVKLPVPRQIKIIGEAAEIDPLTGLPTEESFSDGIITLSDLDLRHKARAVGATQLMSKSVKQANLAGLIQMLSANPTAAALVSWAAMLRYTFKTFDIPNPEEFIVREQLPAVNQLSQEMGQSPEAVVNAAMDPQMMGAMLGAA